MPNGYLMMAWILKPILKNSKKMLEDSRGKMMCGNYKIYIISGVAVVYLVTSHDCVNRYSSHQDNDRRQYLIQLYEQQNIRNTGLRTGGGHLHMSHHRFLTTY